MSMMPTFSLNSRVRCKYPADFFPLLKCKVLVRPIDRYSIYLVGRCVPMYPFMPIFFCSLLAMPTCSGEKVPP